MRKESNTNREQHISILRNEIDKGWNGPISQRTVRDIIESEKSKLPIKTNNK